MNLVTLIPAYKTKYIGELLTGLAVQTRRSERIIVSDDSPAGRFTELLDSPGLAAARAVLPIEVHQGPRSGAAANLRRLVELWDGGSAFVHLLMDDDVIYPEFYELHLMAHSSAELSCSISGRWTASERGQPAYTMPVPTDIRGDSSRMVAMNAPQLFGSTVPYCRNWLGELSNCVLKADPVRHLQDPQLAGVSFAGLWDIGLFLAASHSAPVAYIQDRLGAFRTGHEHQSANVSGVYVKAARLAWVALAVGGRRLGHLSEEQTASCSRTASEVVSRCYPAEADMAPFRDILPRLATGSRGAEEEFLGAWQAYLGVSGF